MPITNAVNASTAGVQCLTSGGVWNGRTITAGSGISVSNGDGVSGNPTISASGSTGGLGQVVVFDDFLGAISTTGGFGNSNLSTTNGTALTSASTYANPGVAGLRVSSNGTAFGLYGCSAQDFTLGGGAITLMWIIKVPVLSNGTQSFIIRAGMTDNCASEANIVTGPANGVWFEYTHSVNSGAWTINCKGAGTTTQNTSNTVDTNFHTLKIIVNAAGSSASFYIDGTETTNSPIATNLPTSGISFCMNIRKTLGNSNVDVYVDMLSFNLTLTTPRSG